MLPLFSILPFLGGALIPTVSAASERAPKNNGTIPGAYMVEFEGSPDVGSFYNDLSSKNINVSKRLDLSYSLFKGASFKLEDTADEQETVNQINSLAKVKTIWPVRRVHLPVEPNKITTGTSITPEEAASALRTRQDSGSEADAYSTHVQTQVDKLRAAGYTGKGVKIGIVDSGLDYMHPALGGGFGAGYLVSYGYDLVGDNYTGYNTPVPDDDPMDCIGHGTHVAGIIAAQPNEFGFTGAAPGVTLGSFKAFGCDGGGADDVLTAAFNLAFEAGSDIITSSTGFDSGWSETPVSVVVQRIVDAGVPCTVSAGNSGDVGQFSTSSAADGKGITSVASFDSSEFPRFLIRATYTTGEANVSTPFGWVAGSISFVDNVTLPLFATSHTTTVVDDACSALPADTPDLSGFIVLIRRGTCAFVTKANNVAAYGAQYVLFYANSDEIFSADVDDASSTVLGAAMVSAGQGAKFVDELNAGLDLTLHVVEPASAGTFFSTVPNAATGGYASIYTSWGPTYELEVYPDVAGIGGNVLSTYPLALGGYAVLSGTSMSTPQVAGIYALIAQVRGTLDPKILGNIITSTAKANLWNDGTATYAGLAPVAQQGPGLIQAYDAAFTTTLLSVNSISFNDTDHFVDSYAFGVENTGSASVTYTLTHVPALTAYTLGESDLWPAYFPNPTTDVAASLAFSESTIEIPAGGAANITVSPTIPAGLNTSLLPIYSGYIVINGTNGDNLTIPYLGLAGSLYNATNLDPTFTYLSTYSDPNSTPVSVNTTLTVPYPTLAGITDLDLNTPYPAVLFQLNLGTRVFRIDVVPLSPSYNGTTTEVLGTKIAGSVYGYLNAYVSRGYYVAPFAGLLDDGSVVPPGQYQLVVKALRIFGDPDVVEDYMTVETVPFTLAYQ
ncbi:minor extracellular protease vpr [Diaporthe helianthi]|uniref:Minor extracellular protease vpr n=1 Tax=Diaporthe helianthi TaxID=158607 RepID=A0A2P5I2A6_DIAHE|nr:minor extracellular protease vpr [Diaporthe helianthi]